MAVSFFDRKIEEPTMVKFEESLNESNVKLWKTFIGDITAVYPKISCDWEYLSKRIGWFLVYKSNEDVLFYVVPQKDYFQINFTFDEDTFVAVQASNLPKLVMDRVLAAEQIDRGYSFFLSVHEIKDVETVEMLLQMQQEIREQE